MIAFGLLKGPLTEQASSAEGSCGVCDIPGVFLSETPSSRNDVRMPFDDVKEVAEEEDVDADDEEEMDDDPLEDSTGGLPSESTQVGYSVYVYRQFCKAQSSKTFAISC